jgi:hypothetical protein
VEFDDDDRAPVGERRGYVRGDTGRAHAAFYPEESYHTPGVPIPGCIHRSRPDFTAGRLRYGPDQGRKPGSAFLPDYIICRARPHHRLSEAFIFTVTQHDDWEIGRLGVQGPKPVQRLILRTEGHRKIEQNDIHAAA